MLFEVQEVPEDTPRRMDAVGSKEKFWFDREHGAWLFKWGRQVRERTGGRCWPPLVPSSSASLTRAMNWPPGGAFAE
jgi:hypothetical protein